MGGVRVRVDACVCVCWAQTKTVRMEDAGAMGLDAAAPLLGEHVKQICPSAKEYFELVSRMGGTPTNVGMLVAGEERGGQVEGFLVKHPDSDLLCLGDAFRSSYVPVAGGPAASAFYTFRELALREDLTFTGGEGGYYLATAVGMARPDDDGWAVEQWARNNAIMAQAGIAPKHERGKVPYKPLLVLPGASILYEAANIDGAMCGGLPTLHFDFHVGQPVAVAGIVSKPEWNGRAARVDKLPADPRDPEARYEVAFTDGGGGAAGFRARARNLAQREEERPSVV